MTVWKRNCPQCDEEVIYSSKRTFQNAYRKNTNCVNCGHKNTGWRTRKSFAIGEVFSTWRIISNEITFNEFGAQMVLCECSCGNIQSNSLAYLKSKSRAYCRKCPKKINSRGNNNLGYRGH